MKSREPATALEGAVDGETSVPTVKEQKDNKRKAAGDVPMDLATQVPETENPACNTKDQEDKQADDFRNVEISGSCCGKPDTDSSVSKPRRKRYKGTGLYAVSDDSSEEEYEVETTPSPTPDPNHPVTLNIKDWKPEVEKKFTVLSDSDSRMIRVRDDDRLMTELPCSLLLKTNLIPHLSILRPFIT